MSQSERHTREEGGEAREEIENEAKRNEHSIKGKIVISKRSEYG
jgi:hypothetical protein